MFSFGDNVDRDKLRVEFERQNGDKLASKVDNFVDFRLCHRRVPALSAPKPVKHACGTCDTAKVARELTFIVLSTIQSSLLSLL